MRLPEDDMLRGEPMQMHAARSQQRIREAYFALIGRHLPALYELVRRQLAHFESISDLAPGELTVEDVVDPVLLRAYRAFVIDPPRRKTGRWLMTLARKHLEAAPKRSKSRRQRRRSLEQHIPEIPPEEEVSTLGDEILDFFEPEEDLKVEDVIPDIDIPTPEDAAESLELKWCVDAAMAGMPRAWRRALRLRHVDGLAEVAIARTFGRSVEETKRILDRARAYLRQRLVESGCHFGGEVGTRDQHG